MAPQNTPEERAMLKWLEKLPVDPQARQGWIEQIRSGGLTEEIATAIHTTLAAVSEQHVAAANRLRFETELARLLRQWRMAAGAKHFTR